MKQEFPNHILQMVLNFFVGMRGNKLAFIYPAY